MSDRMTPIPFRELVEWVLTEYKTGSVFGVKRPYQPVPGKLLSIFGETMETPFGPAAGPNGVSIVSPKIESILPGTGL